MTFVKTILLWSSASAAVVALAGCDLFLGGRARDDRGVYADQSGLYQDRTGYYDQGPAGYYGDPQYVIVDRAPPPLIVERRPSPPSADYVWIDGFWNWDNQQYRWQSGHYERPPQRDARWIAPRYEVVGSKTHFTPGQWREQDQGNSRGRGAAGDHRSTPDRDERNPRSPGPGRQQ